MEQELSRRQRYCEELLPLSALELEAYVRELAQENPVVEWEEPAPEPQAPERAERLGRLRWLEDNDSQNWFYQRLSDEELDPRLWVGTGGGLEETLTSFLSRQLNRRRPEAEQRRAVEYLIRCLEDDGYLRTPLEELVGDFSLPQLEEALALLQSLEPAGVGAQDLSQCLLLQLERIGEDGPALDIVRNHLDQLARRQNQAIAQALDVTEDQVEEAWLTIRELDPRPGAVFQSGEQVCYAQPDLIVEEQEGRLTVRTARGERPLFQISQEYRAMLRQSEDREVREYLADKLEQAEDVLWAVEQRENTLLRIVQLIVDRQEGFFRAGSEDLSPLEPEAAAQTLELSLSELSQAVGEKYLQCARGLLPLNGFFATSAKG